MNFRAGKLHGTESKGSGPLAPQVTQPPLTDHCSQNTGHQSSIAPRSQTAFTLFEVMIACGIFFMATFAILALVTSTVRNARGLRGIQVDAGMVAAQLCKTNKFFEGSDSGDFGDLYPGYSWRYDCNEAETNGLFQFDIAVYRRGVSQPVDAMSIYLFSPESATSAKFGAPGRR